MKNGSPAPEVTRAERKNMKIYVVTLGSYSDKRIITATLDKNLAEAIAKKFDTEYYPHTRIEEFEDAEIMLKPCWFVRFGKDGSAIEVADESDNCDRYEDVNKCGVDAAGQVMVSVIADDSIAAIKIAAERRAEFLAEKAGIV